MASFKPSRILIIEYYDSLVNNIDIYTEKKLEICQSSHTNAEEQAKIHSKRYKKKEKRVFSKASRLNFNTEYLNKTRSDMINEIKTIQLVSLNFYKENKIKIESRIKELNTDDTIQDKLDAIRTELFSNHFCFLLQLNKSELKASLSANVAFELMLLVVEGMYLNERDIQFLK